MQPNVRYCPACAEALEVRDLGEDGRHPVCVRCGFVLWQNLKPCVDALIVRETGGQVDVLLGRRAVKPGKGKWDTPGGFLNADDAPEEKLVQCCAAEVGLRVRVAELIGAFTDAFEGGRIITLYYRCEAQDGEPRPGGVVDQVRWFPIVEPPRLAFAAAEQALKALRARLGRSRGAGGPVA